VALGWGLWEGPARFYFWAKFVFINFSFRRCFPLSLFDFQSNWHNITHGSISPLANFF
jgi:hypothetical protein